MFSPHFTRDTFQFIFYRFIRRFSVHGESDPDILPFQRKSAEVFTVKNGSAVNYVSKFSVLFYDNIFGQ